MKKLPFKPTALRRHAAPSATPESSANGTATQGKNREKEYDDGLDLFRRSKEMEPIVAADRERRLKKKMKKAEEEKLAEEKAKNDDHLQSSPPGKRPLADPRDEDDVFAPDEDYAVGPFGFDSPNDQPSKSGQSGDSQTVKGESFAELVTPPPSKRTRLGDGSSSARSPSNAPNHDESPSTRRLRSNSKPVAIPSANLVRDTLGSSNAPLILDDSDDEVKGEVLTPMKQRRQSGDSVQLVTDPTPAQDSYDDEFGEYVRRAEEKRAKLLASQNATSNAPARKVDILINSPIEGTRSSQITYLFDKPLQRVREAWIALQAKHKVQLPDTNELILTWRRNKVYTYSNLLDLGIRPYGEYGIITDGDNSSGLQDNGTKVHMEMWTPELFEAYLQEEQRRRRHAAGDISDDDEEEEASELLEEVKLKVNLKARDLEDLGLTVRPETTVETLITAFRSKRGIPQDKEVSLRFDGDLLEEHATVEDAGIDDMDTIEVHIK